MNLNYDDYELLEDLGRRNNNRYYRVVCKKCGNIKEVGISNLKKQDNHHSALNCGYGYYRDFIGEKFGDYVVTNITHNEKGFIAEMKCVVCGNCIECQASTIKDKLHNAYTCGRNYYETFIGSVSGDYKIIGIHGYKNNQISFDCECVKCGVKSVRLMQSVKRGVSHGSECLKGIQDSEIKKAIVQRYQNMYERCNNPSNSSYEYYGGRGIKLLYDNAIDLYFDFKDEFAEHARIHGIRNSTFDRIDVNGNYEKSNLRITTQSVQSTNTTRRVVFIIENGGRRVISDSAMECGRRLGINGHSLGNVIRGKSKTSSGWSLYKIVDPNADINAVIEAEGVTTNLIVVSNQRGSR